ncbi:MAG: PHB depolymerase family esterase [Bryobacterales bacterium]|nr:PHB depolymerase family esterase [Bryobacterales bacterium]
MLNLSRFVLVFLGLALWAQDAGMVLGVSVSYNTQRASLPLSDEQRAEAGRLGQEARQQAQAGNYGAALRSYHQGMAVMRTLEWTAALELASSLQAKVDHAMIEPGASAAISLAPLYPCERAAKEKLTVSVFLLPATKEPGPEKMLVSAAPIDPARLPFSLRVTMPDVAAGDYFLEARLASPDGNLDARARASFVKRIPVHVEALAAEVDRLRRSLRRNAPAPPSAEHALALYERIDRSDASPHRYDIRREFAAAHEILYMFEKGRDPFQDKRGDIRKAYRSAEDQTLQPYRLFLPSKYDPAKPAPLVVALHGMGGDENSMFDAYAGGALKREAERLGLLVACPKGREPTSMYRGAAERDVLDVLAEVRRDYRVDPNRIYLMGHSMGGFGTWSIAMNHPELFAALGPFAGGGNPAGIEKIKRIPQYVVHGDNDKTVSVTQSRAMVEAAKQAGSKVVYIEVPGGSHTDVVVPQFGPMLDFFAAQAKPR